jgi:hypothetical protein
MEALGRLGTDTAAVFGHAALSVGDATRGEQGVTASAVSTVVNVLSMVAEHHGLTNKEAMDLLGQAYRQYTKQADDQGEPPDGTHRS